MFLLIYFTVTLIFIYINATGCYIREMKYPWKSDIPKCLIWPLAIPMGILFIIKSGQGE